jgi:hypothetical protein
MLGRQMPFLSKIFKKCLWPHTDSGFCGLSTQNTAKITQGWLKANLKDPWSKEIWPPRSKLTQKRSFGLIRTVDFVPGHPKHNQNRPKLAEGQPEGPLVQGNLASQIKRL